MDTPEIITCAKTECDNQFERATHNQKYCSPECCRIMTNRKIMAKYHERAAIKKGKRRECSKCDTVLSRYNENKICSSCATSDRNTNDSGLKELVSAISW